MSDTSEQAVTRNESTPDGRAFWAKVEAAGEDAPEWAKKRIRETMSERAMAGYRGYQPKVGEACFCVKCGASCVFGTPCAFCILRQECADKASAQQAGESGPEAGEAMRLRIIQLETALKLALRHTNPADFPFACLQIERDTLRETVGEQHLQRERNLVDELNEEQYRHNQTRREIAALQKTVLGQRERIQAMLCAMGSITQWIHQPNKPNEANTSVRWELTSDEWRRGWDHCVNGWVIPKLANFKDEVAAAISEQAAEIARLTSENEALRAECPDWLLDTYLMDRGWSKHTGFTPPRWSRQDVADEPIDRAHAIKIQGERCAVADGVPRVNGEQRQKGGEV